MTELEAEQIIDALLRRGMAHRSRRSRLARIESLLEAVVEKQERLMTVAQDINAQLDRINTATNNLAGDIRTLSGALKPGMTDEEVAALQSRLETSATALEALAAETPDQSATDQPANG